MSDDGIDRILELAQIHAERARRLAAHRATRDGERARTAMAEAADAAAVAGLRIAEARERIFVDSGGVDITLDPSPPARFDAYADDVRAVLLDRWGGDAIPWALDQPFVARLISDGLEADAHAGYTASRVHAYIATRHDLAVARNHEAARAASSNASDA